jgi:hypothetical protein
MHDTLPARAHGKINKRSRRATMAIETLGIAEHARYTLPGDYVVELGDTVKNCVNGTQYISPETLHTLCERQKTQPPRWDRTHLELRNESTLGAARDLVTSERFQHVAALNFARKKAWPSAPPSISPCGRRRNTTTSTVPKAPCSTPSA